MTLAPTLPGRSDAPISATERGASRYSRFRLLMRAMLAIGPERGQQLLSQRITGGVRFDDLAAVLAVIYRALREPAASEAQQRFASDVFPCLRPHGFEFAIRERRAGRLHNRSMSQGRDTPPPPRTSERSILSHQEGRVDR